MLPWCKGSHAPCYPSIMTAAIAAVTDAGQCCPRDNIARLSNPIELPEPPSAFATLAERRLDRMAATDRIISKVEVIAITAMQVLMIVIVAVGTFVLYVLFARNLLNQVTRIESVAGLLPAMQQSFAGVLTVVLGLELLET